MSDSEIPIVNTFLIERLSDTELDELLAALFIEKRKRTRKNSKSLNIIGEES